ncbi:hypothetical protein HMPREF9057_03083, partial [Actinomyces sp. oral taxon 171 str. F0337]
GLGGADDTVRDTVPRGRKAGGKRDPGGDVGHRRVPGPLGGERAHLLR